MLTQEQVLEKLREWMEELFEIAPEDIQLDSNLATDLDVDSIDAIDLVVKIIQYHYLRLETLLFALLTHQRCWE